MHDMSKMNTKYPDEYTHNIRDEYTQKRRDLLFYLKKKKHMKFTIV